LLSNKFINFWKPSKVIFIDSEIWPNTLQNLNRRKIPVILLNARITKKTFKRWMLFKMFAKKIFTYFSVCYPANQETKNYLKNFNVKKIKFFGNIKYAHSNKEIGFTNNNLRKKIKYNRNIWCAASTHYDEEIICGRAHLGLKSKIRNLLTIIIPRHIERTEQIKDDLEKLDLKVIITKDFKDPSLDTDIMIVKAYGKTSLFFKNSSIVFLGGSLINHGGQNPLEATRSGSNIIHGPNVQNFREIYNFLNKLKISHKVTNEKKLILKLVELFKKKNRSINKHRKLKSIGRKILIAYYNDIILKQ
jgi:3-deoxy-D-manno-octulosonic-acid transferase